MGKKRLREIDNEHNLALNHNYTSLIIIVGTFDKLAID